MRSPFGSVDIPELALDSPSLHPAMRAPATVMHNAKRFMS